MNAEQTLVAESRRAGSERDPHAQTDAERIYYGMKLRVVLRSPGDICIQIDRDGSTQSVAGGPVCRIRLLPAHNPEDPCNTIIRDCTAAFAKAVENHRVDRVTVTVSPAGEPRSADISAPSIGAEQRRHAEDAALCLLRTFPHEWLLDAESCD